MIQITASMVKDLRAKTGAGMMDAKKALTENGGDIDAALDWLRTKGLAKAEKKSSRTAAEGLVAVAVDGTKGAVVEINSETDFVSRNEEFQTFVNKVAEIALTVDDVEALKAATYGEKSVADTLTDLIAKIGENMNIRRMEKLEVSNGAVVPYVHGALADGLGKIGVLIALESGASADALAAAGKQIAMHVAATNPQALDRTSVDASVLEREKEVLKQQAIDSGKPPEIAEKMVMGRLNKFYEENCLLDQTYVIDGESKVSDVVAKIADGTKLAAYARVQLGDGIEKEEEDFAAEVSKVANG